MVDAIILAGGQGTRLRSSVPHLPKALAPIQGTAFLQILIDQFSRISFLSRKILALGYEAEAICEFTKKDPTFSVSIEEEPLGTGGAILLALKKSISPTLLIVNGDTFFDLDFEAFYAFHREKKSLATLAVRYEDQDCSRFGSLVIDSDQKITAFQEKCSEVQSGWVSGGIYLIEKEMFEPFVTKKPYSIEKDFFPLFLQKNLFAFPSSKTFIDIGTPESYLEAQHILQSRI